GAVRHEIPRSAAACLHATRRHCAADAVRRIHRSVVSIREGTSDDQPGAGVGAAGLVCARMKHTITLIPGDGIGPEVTEAVVRILNASGVQIEWEPQLAGVLALERTGHTLPVDLLDSIRRNKVALKGPVTTPIAEGFTSVNVGLRKALDLFANLRPVW